tara:strand:+ start:3563 stop:4942 length:1380 start_codon:yes stop_codon:yes gene_type:complete
MATNSIQAPYASEIVSVFDIDKPEILNTLFRAKGDQGLELFQIIQTMGFKYPTAQVEYSHFEENWKHETFQVASTTTAPGGPGQFLEIRLAASSLDAQNNFYPRKGDQVMFPDRTIAVITAITGAGSANVDVTMVPVDNTITLSAADGLTLIINSGAFSEGSTQPLGAFTGTSKYTNNTQIIKETMTATGTEMTNQKWFDKLDNGKGIPAYYIKGQQDTEYRMALKVNGALLFSQRSNNTANLTDPDTGRAIRTTEGLVPFITRTGHQKFYTGGSFSVQNFNDAVKTLDKEFAPNYICALNGIDLDIEIEDALVDYFKDTNINYAQSGMAKSLLGGNEGLAASVGFRYLMKGQRTFGFKRMGVFSHDKLYGAPGYNTAGLGVLIPMSKVKDKKTMMEVPTFGMRYKKLGKYDRMMEVWNVNGAGVGTKVIADDLHNFFLRCDIGFHGAAGNQMLLWDRS